MQKKLQTPNPAGRQGKPFSLAHMNFDDAVRKILAAPPVPKRDKPKPKKKQAKGNQT
jgi:hypothetical protein